MAKYRHGSSGVIVEVEDLDHAARHYRSLTWPNGLKSERFLGTILSEFSPVDDREGGHDGPATLAERLATITAQLDTAVKILDGCAGDGRYELVAAVECARDQVTALTRELLG